MGAELGIERDQLSIEGAVMQGAKCDAIVGVIRTVGMCRWQDVRGIQQAELNATHGTAMAVGTQYAIAKTDIAQRSPRGNHGIAARCGNRALHIDVVEFFRLAAELLQQVDLALELAALV